LSNGINPTTGVYTLQDDLNVAGNLTISSGMMDVGAADYDVRIAGNFTNNADFNPRTGTVTMNGTTTGTVKTNGVALNNLEVNNGLVGYWNMNEGSGTNASDNSGNSSSATLTNGATWTTSTKDTSYYGLDPNAMSLDGTNDFATAPNNTAISSSQNMT